MHMSNGIIRRRYRSVLALIAVPPVVLLASSPGAVAAGAGPPPPLPPRWRTVTVNAGQSVATVPSTAIGLNASTYDADVTDAAVPGLISNAGVSLIRFPGGTESDKYNWKTNTDVLSGAPRR